MTKKVECEGLIVVKSAPAMNWRYLVMLFHKMRMAKGEKYQESTPKSKASWKIYL